MALTPQQMEAASFCSNNTVITAGAGTGKTEVLTEHFINLLRADFPIEKIVCITYTVKAANEMKERIQAKLIKANEKKWIRSFHKANIMTIHAFYLSLIRRYADIIGIDPECQIDESLEKDILDDAIDEEMDVSRDAPIMNWMGYRKKDDFKAFLRELYLCPQRGLSFKETLKKFRALLADAAAVNKTKYKEQIWNKTKEGLDEVLQRYQIKKNCTVFHQLLNNWTPFDEEATFDDLKQIENKISRSSNSFSEAAKMEMKRIETRFKELFLLEPESYTQAYETLYALMIRIEEKVLNKKREKSYLSYADIERCVYSLLQKPSLRQQIQKEYVYFMVDEVQDASEIQINILKLLSSDNTDFDLKNLYLVGDGKQSIYAFRGANPRVFSKLCMELESFGARKVELNKNFRSEKSLINTVNDIYGQRMRLPYSQEDRYCPMEAVRDEIDSAVYQYKDYDLKSCSLPDVINMWAQEKGDCYSGITILTLTNAKAREIQLRLNDFQIKTVLKTRNHFPEDPIIRDCLVLFQYIRTRKTKDLVALLKSAFYNFSDEDLKNFFENQDAEENIKLLDSIHRSILDFQRKAQYGIFDALLHYIQDSELMLIYDSTQNDLFNQTNLYNLLWTALEADRQGLSVIEFIDQMIDKKALSDLKPDDDSIDAVSLMTLHGSKGLSLDYVVLPYLANTKSNPPSDFLYTDEYGIGLRSLVPSKKDDLDFFYYRNVCIYNDIRLDQEENLYYVAMTRAKKKLALDMSGKNSGYKKKLLSVLKEDALPELTCLKKIQVREHNRVSLYSEIKEDFSSRDVEICLSLSRFNISQFLNYMEAKKKEGKAVPIAQEILLANDSVQEQLPRDLTGTIVHYFCRIFDGDRRSAEQRVREVYKLEDREVQLLTPYFTSFIKMNPPATAQIFREYSFNTRIGKAMFGGIIDRMEIGQESIKIIDFKVSRLGPKALLKKYYWQVFFYGMITKKVYPHHNIELEIQNLKYANKVNFSYPTDPQKEDELLKLLEEFVDFMQKIK